MPQYRNSQICQGFVNPTQLYSTFPVIYDYDMVAQAPFETHSDIEVATPLSSRRKDSIFDAKNFKGWTCEPATYSSTPTWSAESSVGTSSVRDDCSGSSASDSPSPGTLILQPGQSQKRRAQNRAAQRAYRDRKMRYLVDLQSGIQEIEQKIRLLQTENTELIRELCEMRAANNDLRDSNASKEPKGTNQDDIANPEASSNDGPAEAWSRANFTSSATGELDALYEPFAAMWNLIHLDPSVVQGSVSAQTVLERLQEMVQFSTANADVKAPRSYSTSDIPVRPAKTQR